MPSYRAISICISVAITAISIALQTETIHYNFGNTLSWTPGKVLYCDTTADVLTAVESAIASGEKIKAFGTGWSWNTAIAGDGDTYVILSGGLSDINTAELNTTDQTVVAGGGTQSFDLFMLLQTTSDPTLNLEAKGGCLTAAESQTVGGLLATNVHHAGIKTFYDVVEWIEVVTSTSGLVRAYRNDTLFQLTIGGKGRTGIIVRVKFNLAPRATYQNIETRFPADPDSFASYFNGYTAIHEGVPTNELICMATKAPYTSASYPCKLRMAVPSPNPRVIPPNFGDLSPLVAWVSPMDQLLDRTLPPTLYDYWYALLLAVVLPGKQPPTRNTVGEDLDVASSGSYTPHMKHQELEFFVPVDLMGEVGEYLDTLASQGNFPYTFQHGLWVLRYVYGVESLTAPSGVLHDGTVVDVVAVNIDSYQRSMWGVFNGELAGLMALVSAEFPRMIRLHPGKYNAPVSPDPESEGVKALLVEWDPVGVFAREEFNDKYVTQGWRNLRS